MYTGEYEKPKIERYALLYTLSPAGSKLGHGVFPFAGRHKPRSWRTRRDSVLSRQTKVHVLALSS